jgi:osmotically inducible protein OsmC
MALALALTRNGTPAERLEVHGVCELDRSGGEHEYEITGLRLDVTAAIPGLDEPAFLRIAERADRECPISNALRGSVPVRLSCRLQTA